MKTIDFSHFIERYISGEMSEDERLWFEKELEGNKNLCAEVELRRKTEAILEKQDVITLRNKLVAIEKKHKEKEKLATVASMPRIGYIRYAAAFTLLVAIGSAAVFYGNHKGNGDLTDKYYSLYQPPVSNRSSVGISSGDFALAMEFYNTNDFANAANLFRKVVDHNPHDMQSVLLYGVSSFEDKKYPEAKQSFTTVIDDNNNLFIETARWYLALCYIKTNERADAQVQLKQIIKEDGLYSRNAKKLLKGIY